MKITIINNNKKAKNVSEPATGNQNALSRYHKIYYPLYYELYYENTKRNKTQPYKKIK